MAKYKSGLVTVQSIFLLLGLCFANAYIQAPFTIALLPSNFLRSGANLTVLCTVLPDAGLVEITSDALQSHLRVRWSAPGTEGATETVSAWKVNSTTFAWTLTNVRRANSGTYQCVNMSDDGHTSYAHAELFVGDPPELFGLACEWPNRDSAEFSCLPKPGLEQVWRESNILISQGRVHLVLQFADSSTGFAYRQCSSTSEPVTTACSCDAKGLCRWTMVDDKLGSVRGDNSSKVLLRARACNLLGWCGRWILLDSDRREFEQAGPVIDLRVTTAINVLVSPSPKTGVAVVAEFSPPTRPDPARLRDYECRLRLRLQSGIGETDGHVEATSIANATRLLVPARGNEKYAAIVDCRPRYFNRAAWSTPVTARLTTPVWRPCAPELALRLLRTAWVAPPPDACRNGPILSYALLSLSKAANGTDGQLVLIAELSPSPSAGENGGFWAPVNEMMQGNALAVSAATSAGQGPSTPIIPAVQLAECLDGDDEASTASHAELQVLLFLQREDEVDDHGFAASARWRLRLAESDFSPPSKIAACHAVSDASPLEPLWSSCRPISPPKSVMADDNATRVSTSGHAEFNGSWVKISRRQSNGSFLVPSENGLASAPGGHCVCRQRAFAMEGESLLNSAPTWLRRKGYVEFEAAPRRCGLRGLFVISFDVAYASSATTTRVANCSRIAKSTTRFRCPLSTALLSESTSPSLRLRANLLLGNGDTKLLQLEPLIIEKSDEAVNRIVPVSNVIGLAVAVAVAVLIAAVAFAIWWYRNRLCCHRVPPAVANRYPSLLHVELNANQNIDDSNAEMATATTPLSNGVAIHNGGSGEDTNQFDIPLNYIPNSNSSSSSNQTPLERPAEQRNTIENESSPYAPRDNLEA